MLFHMSHWSGFIFALLFQISFAQERISAAQGNFQSCLFHSSDTYPLYGSKTAYSNNLNMNKNDDHHEEELDHKCTPKFVWFLSRHGTRNPGVKYMRRMREHLPILRDQILENHGNGQGELCHIDLQLLNRWHMVANDSKSKYLVEEGFSELEGIGKRLKKKFTELFKTYSNESYTFAYTESQRTEVSALAFAKGLFEDNHHEVLYRPPVTPDPLLRFYKLCPRWRHEVHKNGDAFVFVKKFESGPEMSLVRSQVSVRLGFNRTLTQSEVDLVYLMCAFDEAWRPSVDSPWCSVFTPADLKVIEYREDLKYYYDSGYGFEVNYHQGCAMVRDILAAFLKAISDSTAPKGYFYFSHSGTVLKFLTRMGLFKDKIPLRDDNFWDQRDRKWRTSFIDSFASNVAIILHECNGEYTVTTYVQEKIVHLPFCEGTVCKLKEFLNGYGEIGHSCDLDSLCQLPLNFVEKDKADLPEIEDA